MCVFFSSQSQPKRTLGGCRAENRRIIRVEAAPVGSRRARNFPASRASHSLCPRPGLRPIAADCVKPSAALSWVRPSGSKSLVRLELNYLPSSQFRSSPLEISHRHSRLVGERKEREREGGDREAQKEKGFLPKHSTCHQNKPKRVFRQEARNAADQGPHTRVILKAAFSEGVTSLVKNAVAIRGEGELNRQSLNKAARVRS